MRVIHVSDTHGSFPELPEGDIVIHSGDFMPNRSRMYGDPREPFDALQRCSQREWCYRSATHMKEWLGGRPFVFCEGNHDFFPGLPRVLREAGIDAHDATNQLLSLKGLSIYGFPFIPTIVGSWNWERTYGEMVTEIRTMHERIPDKLDILVAHCPVWGVLDYDDRQHEHFGNTALMNYLSGGAIVKDEKGDAIPPKKPRHLLCGHIHENPGGVEWEGIQVSQAATVVRVLDI